MSKQPEQTVMAVYENGVFRPLEPLHEELQGDKVCLRVDTVRAALKALEEVTHIFDGISEEEIDEIEAIALGRTRKSGVQQEKNELAKTQAR